MRNHGRPSLSRALEFAASRYKLSSFAILLALSSLTGCTGGIGSTDHAQIRKVDVSTNILNAQNNNSDTSVLNVNSADTFLPNPVVYGVPTGYLYLDSGNSTFQASTTLTLPYLNGSAITPPKVSYNLTTGTQYSGYITGRPDVANPTQSNLSDLDPRFLQVVILANNQPAPPTGQTTLRVLNAACDAGNITVQINGSAPAAFTAVPYASLSNPSSPNATVASGNLTIQVTSSSTSAILVPSKTIALNSGGEYTLVVNEPTAAPTPAVLGVAPTSATYNTILIAN